MKYGQRNDGNRDIILTFDDGPSPKTTAPLLDVLAKHGIKAMFFAVGRLLQTPDGAVLAKRAKQEGHILGNHSFSHPNLRGMNKDQVRDELRRTHDLICECSGDCKYFRPPYGAGGDILSEVILELGYTTVLWNVDTLDWKLKKDDAWVDNAMTQIKEREDCIVLMHDIHKTPVDYVEPLVNRIKRIPGHRFVVC